MMMPMTMQPAGVSWPAAYVRDLCPKKYVEDEQGPLLHTSGVVLVWLVRQAPGPGQPGRNADNITYSVLGHTAGQSRAGKQAVSR